MVHYNAEHYQDPTAGAAERHIKEQAQAAVTARAIQRKGVHTMRNKILAIDPGTTESGCVVVEHDGHEISKVLRGEKIANELLLAQLPHYVGSCDIAVEMVASYGMAVGREVFETCVWIGRFMQAAGSLRPADVERSRIYRTDEKSTLCHSQKAKDSNIVQALVDRYAYGQPNFGKGTKRAPGFFYGFKKDTWQAMAVAVTYFDTRVRRQLETVGG